MAAKKKQMEKKEDMNSLSALGVMLMAFGAVSLELGNQKGGKRISAKTRSKNILRTLCIERIKNIRNAVLHSKLKQEDKQELIGELIKQLA